MINRWPLNWRQRRLQQRWDFLKKIARNSSPVAASPDLQTVLRGRQATYQFPLNACRGERCGVWGRTAHIKPVPSAHLEHRVAFGNCDSLTKDVLLLF
jgi:hypothetical protein